MKCGRDHDDTGFVCFSPATLVSLSHTATPAVPGTFIAVFGRRSNFCFRSFPSAVLSSGVSPKTPGAWSERGGQADWKIQYGIRRGVVHTAVQ